MREVINCKNCKYYDDIEDTEPTKHGRWVHKYGDGHEEPAITGGECSLCGFVNTVTNYCPNCGAKMDGVSDD